MSPESDNFDKKNDQSYTSIMKDIGELKNQISNISSKIDLILDIMNNFTLIMTEEEEEEDEEENYDDDESWVPEQDEDWNSYEDEDDEY